MNDEWRVIYFLSSPVPHYTQWIQTGKIKQEFHHCAVEKLETLEKPNYICHGTFFLTLTMTE